MQKNILLELNHMIRILLNRIEFVFLSLKLRGGLFKFLGNGTAETLMHLIIRCYSKFMKLKFIGSKIRKKILFASTTYYRRKYQFIMIFAKHSKFNIGKFSTQISKPIKYLQKRQFDFKKSSSFVCMNLLKYKNTYFLNKILQCAEIEI